MRKLLIILCFVPFAAFSQWHFLIPSDTLNLLPTMTTIDSITSGYLSMRPQLSYATVAGQGAPTTTAVGVYQGFLMPIYTGGNKCQMFFREYVAGRWDGKSDIIFSVVCALSEAETEGEDFAFELAWSNKSSASGVVPVTTTNDTVQQNLESGRALQYSIYRLEFTIDWDINNPDVVAADELAGRLRRIAVDGGDEVESDVIVLDWMIKYTVDKVFKKN